MFVEDGPSSNGLAEVPTPRLESEITSLAGHLNAGMARWLALVGEFDRREAWASWGCLSCAQWLSWRCGVTPGTAREQTRVARALADLPLIRAEFAAGRLSYSQVRALTRAAHPEVEEDLLELARHATAAQLERLVRGYRTAAAQLEEANAVHERRALHWFYESDGSVVFTGRLAAEEAAVVIEALRAMERELEPPATEPTSPSDPSADVSAETHERPSARAADALVAMAETALARGAAARPGGERCEVVVHVDLETLADDAPGRCELADGTAVAPETGRRLACDAGVVSAAHRDGGPPDVGRRTRSIPARLRRALHARDGGCRFPGCTQRRFVDGHHIRHWARGGPTDLDNLVLLCRRHHRLLHEGGYTVRPAPDGRLTFQRPSGVPIPATHPPRGGRPTALEADNRLRGATITPTPPSPAGPATRSTSASPPNCSSTASSAAAARLRRTRPRTTRSAAQTARSAAQTARSAA